MPVKSVGFAIGNLRARENRMLKKSDMLRLAAASDTDELAAALSDSGIDGKEGAEIPELLSAETEKLWKYLTDNAPDMSLFEPFIYENDFHNFKAVLKGTLRSREYKSLLITPASVNVALLERAVKENPEAKAIFVNNPTYYGVCSDIKRIAQLAHSHGMYLLADEAHGTHFYFGDNMPIAGMHAGADLSAVSMHKSGGSLTQSSFLLTGDNISEGYVRQIINLMQTTSGSYLLMSSLDISRRNLALNGKQIFAKVQSYAEYMRSEINDIGGYYAFSKELCDGGAFYDFDITKLSVHTRDIGLAGIEVYDILRDNYGIQIEFGDIGNILAYVSIGDRELYLDRLIGALNDIKRIYSKDKTGMLDHEYINPIVRLSPQQAFYGEKESVPIEQSAGRISGEFVMCYPPGIPILAPGEQITQEILAYIKYAGEKGCFLTGTEDLEIKNIRILKE